ncbi:hypothetical protein [Flavisolibacter tropicus]|uniref:Outer membrane protein beta-barrel domain-containing protein n=1 Tax=Flavisolibacter tropicus TaxID=1492898 RepID=A0A172U1C7_9BACT|nr:hypothetical protein [Flavisolibacter tropicus]ANE52833.1 hypothetical protein SY85_22500 [Flavisolibacter tropicus]
MKRCYKYFLLLTLSSTYATATCAQALDQLGIKKGVKINGSVSANTVAYMAAGIDSRRDPFNWFLQGNLNLSLFGYSMPFSFSYSNQNRSFSQPFNRFQFAPSYKWAKAYLGTTSMAFSNYTLAGHMFDGVGVELSPGKWRVSVMQGRLLKAVPFDIANKESYNSAAFERKGYGIKAGFDNNGNSYSFSLFKALDNVGSLEFIPIDATLSPKENVAAAVAVRQTIWKRLFMDMEYSVSALNRDVRSSKSVEDSSSNKGQYNFLKSWLSPTQTTTYFDALQSGIGFTGNFYNVQLRYERVAPGYTTLGAYNVINDLRNITVAPTLQLFSGRLNLAANAGVQDNNLDRDKASTTHRWVGSGNLSFMPNEKWLFNTSYSNFSTITRVRPLTDPFFNNPLDSLNFYQVNTTYNGMASYSFGSKEVKHSMMTNLSYQKASDKQWQPQSQQQQISAFYTGNIGYTYNLIPKGFSLTAGGNYYVQEAPDMQTTFLGPSINASRVLMKKKLRLSTSSAYNITHATISGASTKSAVWNAGFQASFAPKARETTSVTDSEKKKGINGKHAINVAVNYLNQSAVANRPSFSELTATVGYNWSF